MEVDSRPLLASSERRPRRSRPAREPASISSRTREDRSMDQAWPSSPLPARLDQLLGARKVKRRGPGGVGGRTRWNGWKDGCGGARGQVGERHLSGRPSDAGDRACRPVESPLGETTRHGENDEDDAQEARKRAARMGRRSSETATAHVETFEAFRRSPGRVRARDAQTGRARPGQAGGT